MSGLLFLAASLLIPAAFAVGMWAADRLSGNYWRDYHYCPTCSRFKTDYRDSVSERTS